MFDIKEELKKLPSQPGVYLMHDSENRIMYVGKAVNLKNRVRQYFQKTVKRNSKVLKMIEQIDWFETIVVDSETEALVLECNLIKEYRPPYNTMLTDDKEYPYISLTVDEAYPRVLLARTMKRDKCRYFGPYTNVTAVKDTIRLLQKIFFVRNCSRRLPEDIGKDRPCLNYQMHLCLGPCQGYISGEEYNQNIQQVENFLKGHYQPVLKLLEDKMNAASEAMDYEQAITYRDLMYSVKKLDEKQKITDTGQENRDIIAMAADGPDGIAQVFFIRNGKMIGRDHFHLSIAEGDSKQRVLTEFVKQFYAGTPFLPREILLPEEPEDRKVLEEWLTVKNGHKVSFVIPQKGEKHKLLQLAEVNAQRVLKQDKESLKREEERTIGASERLEKALGLEGIIRMESYDISNISGFQSVGSMVVYEYGKPKKNDYRKFRIKSVQGANDYASLYEVLMRRFSHGLEEQNLLKERGMDDIYGKFSHFPDLILMDGGKGQVSMAQEVLDRLNLQIPVCGMVKDDHHRTRGLYYEGKEIPLDSHSEEFKLITRIQDETHRFAIEYHRSIRGKEQVHSILDDIPGIGPKRRKALMRDMKSIDKLRSASLDELTAIPEMNQAAALQVYAFFHDGEIPDPADDGGRG